MARIWSDESKLARWLDVELAALESWADVGGIPRDDVAEITAHAVPPSPVRVAELEQVTDHDVAAFVDAVAEQLGSEGRWLHYGLTSSDVVDTALSLQIREAGRLVVDGIARCLSAVVARADEHRHTICIGRSHGVHAEPITFGWKLASWAFELDRGRARMQRALETNRIGQLSGTVGTYAQVEPEVERLTCERLGLEPDPLSTQIVARDRHAELLCALALVAASIERFATEIRHLARTEVGEVEEPFRRGMKGSSAMPHKRNPKVAERLCGLARVVRANALVGLENVPLWHERDISQSSAERIVIPDSFLAFDYMLDRLAWIVEGLVVHSDRMRRNLDASHGLVFSHRLLLALVDSGLARDDAYRLVQAHAMQAWEEEQSFKELVSRDPAVASRADLDEVFDLDASVRHVETVFDRLHSLVQKEEPFMSETALHVGSGKVRELYALDDERLLLVASDRISTFDVVLPTEIPDKGRVLTGLSAFWFARTSEICPNHLLGLRADGRSTECRRLEMLPIECVVRGFLAGSGWKDYQRTGAVCGHRLPPGLAESDALPEPIFTPATKATSGHDENIDRDQAAELVGPERLAEVERVSLALYRFASEHARARGILIADTKFEFGLDEHNGLVLGDEALTPDSSRFWPAGEYRPGAGQPSFDKQFVRDYCETLGWDKTEPGPKIPEGVVAGTHARYVEAFERLTGISFDAYTADPEVVLR